MSNEWILSLIDRHSSHGIIVDTNLLLLYFIGLQSEALVEKFKRTQMFTRNDFFLLQAFLSKFQKILTTPGVLAEVNSLANQLPEDARRAFMHLLRNQIQLLDESYVPSKQAAEHRHFVPCGLTDSAIMIIASENFLVLTSDFELAGYLEGLGVECINFNHIRFISGSR